MKLLGLIFFSSGLQIGPFEVAQDENAKIKVKACVTLHGTVTLASALVSISFLVMKCVNCLLFWRIYVHP